jgi:type I restriction enzyme S subunit
MREGWEIKKLGEICEILDSQRKPVTKKYRKEGLYPYYGASGIQDYVDSYIFDGRYLLVGEDGAKWGTNDKSAFIIEGKCWVNNHAHILKVYDNLKDSFIEYYLVFKDLNEYITGAIVPKLTQQALKNIPIPVPSLSEQEKIVAELDCLSGIIEKRNNNLKNWILLLNQSFMKCLATLWKMKKVGRLLH